MCGINRAHFVFHNSTRVCSAITKVSIHGAERVDVCTQFEASPADNSGFVGFTQLRVTTDRVGPDARPGFFVQRAAGDQQLAQLVKYPARESGMQGGCGGMRRIFFQRSAGLVLLIQ